MFTLNVPRFEGDYHHQGPQIMCGSRELAVASNVENAEWLVVELRRLVDTTQGQDAGQEALFDEAA